VSTPQPIKFYGGPFDGQTLMAIPGRRLWRVPLPRPLPVAVEVLDSPPARDPGPWVTDYGWSPLGGYLFVGMER
jgi:hypothetical protein